ncbi:UNVERIFIED_CONTAM: hypothetical protein GTU68_007528 [Idotea baltica]|nr:hypothetical protein [Idotea baltica]
MSRFAFKPIAEALKTREHDIQNALDEAENARKEIASLKAQNDVILAEARTERAKMLKEATDTKNAIISEAKEKAKEEANRVISSATLAIEKQKKDALLEVKNQVGTMATQIAEKILRKELNQDPAHTSYVNTLVDEMNLN